MSNTASWLKMLASLIITGAGITVINLGSLWKAFSFSEIFSFPDGFDLILESFHAGIYLFLIFALTCWLNRQVYNYKIKMDIKKYIDFDVYFPA
jgi:hypothetical protein